MTAPEPVTGSTGSPDTARMCPSTPAANATVVLGVVTPPGRVAYVTPAIPVTPQLLIALDDGRGPLKSRFRFSGTCVESGCGFWTGRNCGLGERVATSFATVTADEAAADGSTHQVLPRCAIRSRCRWFAEQGPAACVACPYVVTESRA